MAGEFQRETERLYIGTSLEMERQRACVKRIELNKTLPACHASSSHLPTEALRKRDGREREREMGEASGGEKSSACIFA